jgi:uncharacterized protein
MQLRFAHPDEFGNSGNELFRGQSHGFAQSNQGGLNQGNNLIQGNGLNQGGMQRQETQNTTEQPRRRGRGFASMDPARVSEIASMGGKAAHEQGVAHEWTPEEARRAGRKGGQASRGHAAADTKTQSAGG